MNNKKHVYAFIDSQNLNVTTQKYGWKMNWKRFRKFLSDKYGVTKAFMFIGYIPEQIEMYESLHAAGYAVVLKPTFDMTRAEEKPKDENAEKKPVKGNIDADLVLWAMKEVKKYDEAVIVTGDGDFFSLVEYLAEQGKLGKLLTPGPQYSQLFNQFEKYMDRIDKYRHHLEYRTQHKQPTKKP